MKPIVDPCRVVLEAIVQSVMGSTPPGTLMLDRGSPFVQAALEALATPAAGETPTSMLVALQALEDIEQIVGPALTALRTEIGEAGQADPQEQRG